MRYGLVISLLLLGCGSGSSDDEPDATPVPERPEAAEDWTRDVLATDLVFDVANLSGTATITLAPSDSKAASLEIGDLSIGAVHDDVGALKFEAADGQLDVGVPSDGAPAVITVDYEFAIHDDFDGYMSNKLTLLWPYFCHNLFPCKSDPADGLTFTLELQGLPDGSVGVYPEEIATDSPSYMIAFAIGDYIYEDLGTTTDGTEVGVWYIDGERDRAINGTSELVGVMDWFEQTLGPYPFGDRVASVAATWRFGAYGGMEHHPYWHVARAAMGSHEVQAHEAAHGWFGDGVRIACWEDFVLSEGLASYLAARAIEQTEGILIANEIWSGYQSDLDSAVAGGDTEALPLTCGEIDILVHDIWSQIPYMKGAFFMRDVELLVGRAELDAALSKFYVENVGQAAHMQDLLDTIEAETGADLDPLADAWLRSLGVPQ